MLVVRYSNAEASMRHVVRTASSLYVRRMCSAEWIGSSGVVFETTSFIRPHLFADGRGTRITKLRGPDAVCSVLPNLCISLGLRDHSHSGNQLAVSIQRRETS